MRAGKEEEREPMFPRLHVNDTTSKGGPRAPPRNKMALYEQLSVPSHSQAHSQAQRFTSTTSSASTRPPHHNHNSTSTQKRGGVEERPLFSSFNVATRFPGDSSEKVNHQSNDAAIVSPTGAEAERRPIKLVRRELVSSSKQSTAPDSSSRQTREDNSSSRQNRKDSGSKRPVEEDDDFMVPTLFNQTKTKTKTTTTTTDKGLMGQVRLLPRFSASAENSNKNSKSMERGEEDCSQKRERKEEGKGGREKADVDVLHEGFVEETMLGISISPDDVVGAIGHKTFWKARRLIVNQQRVFAVQVFELHRLLKVQKLIAASPDVLVQSDPVLGKKLAIKAVAGIGPKLIAAQLEGSKQSDERTMTTDIPEETPPVLGIETNTNTNSSYQEQPAPSFEEASAPSQAQARSTAAVSSVPVPVPVPPPENNPSHSSCLPPSPTPTPTPTPTPNQWLVPVMSPSEGLVYKPYTGSYPPAATFMSPFFPGCMAPLQAIPTIPTAATPDFINSAAYGVPVPMPVPVPPHPSQNMGVVGLPNYFPPFGMQVMNHNPNPVMSTSAVEQVSHLMGSKPDGTVRAEQHSRGSCNMVQMKSDAFSGCMWGFRASKDSEVQGSTASSPFDRDRDRGDAAAAAALPFFQMGSASLDASLPLPKPSSSAAAAAAGNTPRAIKVVPHNPQLATQSAARIFQSIQKERKHNE